MDAIWTVMVLMGANNLPKEKPLGRFAKDDLKEMQSVGSKSGVLNIVVQIDQKPEAGGPKRYFVAKGQLRDVGPIPPGEGSSGDPVVLENFLSWAKTNYRATHYLLVLWGHAYRLAFNRDGNDALDFPKLARTLQKTFPEGPIDIVAFDSCNVSLIEGAYELRSTARFMVASQFTDPLPGWPYHEILVKPKDDPTMDADDLGRAIVSQFVRHYTGQKSVSMTMLDLRFVNEIRVAIDDLATTLLFAVSGDSDERSRLHTVFQWSQVSPGQPGIDLTSFCWHLTKYSGNAEARNAARTLGNLLLKPTNPFIAAHGTSDLDVTMLRGVSAFAPNVVSNAGFEFRSLQVPYQALGFSTDSVWDELVFALAEPGQ